MAREVDNRTDEELMLQFKGGDEACFRVLVDRHKQRIFNLTFRFLDGNQDAEDIAQEVFVKVYFARNTYQPTARFTTWLYVIARNACLQALRKKSPSLSLDESSAEKPEGIRSVLPDEKSPEPCEAAMSAERQKMIGEALRRLPESQRLVILLKRYDDLSYEEIAEIMSCSIQAVKSLLFRGRQAMKEFLKEYLRESV